MKKIALFILFFVSLAATAQSNSFTVSNNKLVWENVFISNEANIPTLVARHTRLKITSSNTAIFKGTGTELRNSCPGTSAFLKGSFSFDFEIEVSDGKYRVTITNLIFNKTKKKGSKNTNAEVYLIKDGNLLSDETAQADLTCLDNYFNKIFTMTMLYKNRS